MPTKSSTSGIVATDTATVETFTPTFPDGIADTLGNSIQVELIDTLPVMPTRKSYDGIEYATSPELASGIMLLTTISFLLLAFSFRKGFKYFFTLIKAPFSIRTRENAFEDRTINETFVLTTLISNTCIAGGIVLFNALSQFHYITDWNIKELIPVLICIGASAGLFAFQSIVYRLIGYVFSDREYTRVWLEGYNATQALLGLALIPIALALNIHSTNASTLSVIALILFIISRILFISKGFRIFFTKIQSQLLFILYLCAVELVPVILFFTGAVYLCNLLQS